MRGVFSVARALWCLAFGPAVVACQAALDLESYEFGSGEGGSRAVPPLQPAGAAGAGSEGPGVGGTASAPPADASAGGGPSACSAACELPHARAECVDAGCVISACVGPWRDANGSSDDGCEAGDVPGEGLTLWFMADQGVVLQPDGSVSAWLDQSPNGFTASQAVLAQRPTLARGPDGLPMLAFDGTDDYLDLPPGFATFAGASVFIVAEALPNPLCAGILHFSNGPDIDDVEFGRHQTNLWYYEVQGSFLNGTSGGFVVDRRLVLSAVQASSTGATGPVELRIDGALDQVGSVDLPAVVERRQNYLGRNAYTRQPDLCSVYFRGRIGELIFYPRGLDAAERERVEAYLHEKWQSR